MTSPAQGWEVVIGLEVHVELATRSKMFCACPATFGDLPNTNVCPVCLGLPGSLPVPNRRAIELALRAALALGCRIPPAARFDRKNYHYPDLPKGYQISQYEEPLGIQGHLDLPGEDGEPRRRVRIRRVHLEEDTGKSVHDPEFGTLVDLNRAGVPLIEIVSEPDLRSADEARAYLEELRDTMLYAGVSDVKMEEGSLRCDANVSLRPAGSQAWGTLVEVKNMNSFRSVKLALEYEAERQARLLSEGLPVRRETRHWDEREGVTRPGRGKEEAEDYRYFPEPDLPPLALPAAWVEEIRTSLPELPAARRRRYQSLGVRPYDARILVAERHLGEFFERAVQAGAEPQAAANWTLVEWQAYVKETGKGLAERPDAPEKLAKLLALLARGAISGPVAKDVFREMLETGGDPEAIVAASGRQQIADEKELLAVAREVLSANEKAVADYRKGKRNALAFLVGQVMRTTRGRANPEAAARLLERLIEEG
ncbi:MAG: Asp-tRNA(Asn)/Glu-tRNA(Gln) amidotransferase subunit GatB [Clostridia bacterium]|nr:Asp-tRNA(Asn)/Glu-tRNA(Gln) amidotransferase subunit GatB [Clostridia bacterium]